jgi:hypothetical protein
MQKKRPYAWLAGDPLHNSVEPLPQARREVSTFRLLAGKTSHGFDSGERLIECFGGDDLQTQPRPLHGQRGVAISGSRADENKVGPSTTAQPRRTG